MKPRRARHLFRGLKQPTVVETEHEQEQRTGQPRPALQPLEWAQPNTRRPKHSGDEAQHEPKRKNRRGNPARLGRALGNMPHCDGVQPKREAQLQRHRQRDDRARHADVVRAKAARGVHHADNLKQFAQHLPQHRAGEVAE